MKIVFGTTSSAGDSSVCRFRYQSYITSYIAKIDGRACVHLGLRSWTLPRGLEMKELKLLVVTLLLNGVVCG